MLEIPLLAIQNLAATGSRNIQWNSAGAVKQQSLPHAVVGVWVSGAVLSLLEKLGSLQQEEDEHEGKDAQERAGQFL